MKKQLLIFFVIAPAFGILLAGARVYYQMNIWKFEGESIHFKVKSGEGFSSINARLKKQKIISNATLFYRYCQFKDLMTKFRAGTFEIKTKSNMFSVLDALLYSSPIGIKVTVPEGKNMYEIAKIMDDKGIVSEKDFIALAKNTKFVNSLGIEGKTVEGFLYPDTYLLEPKTPARQVIKNMHQTFKKMFKPLVNNSGLTDFELITLASMVEKETGAGFERPVIAGVFLNRLKKKMRLQSDPTTIYGIWKNYNGNLRKKHLLQKTPYNTYKIPALPVGPIANPGVLAIKAVLNPESHNYYYFVSKNDGTHIFSKTYSEHAKAVNHYQKNYKNRQGKSWRDLKQKTNN